tara:strand:- start:1967 stop:2266 length:300 start_codon:yes stop_codon:yes gene_type:complete
MKKLYKKTTIYVVRCDKNNKLQDSAPCIKCLSTIIELGIKKIVYSSSNNKFISCNPIDITLHHISSGNRHLIKNNEDDKKNNSKVSLEKTNNKMKSNKR